MLNKCEKDIIVCINVAGFRSACYEPTEAFGVRLTRKRVDMDIICSLL